MEHAEFIKISSDKRVAVVMIHGIVGTPNHFAPFIPLVDESFSIYNILLEGHGKGVNDFSKASMEKWKTQVETLLTELSQSHEEIIILAHSMGTLLALNFASRFEKVKRLVLLAVPLKIKPKISAAPRYLKIALDKVDENDNKTLQIKNAYGISADKKLWRYVAWAPRYLELFSLIREVRKNLSEVKIPVYAFLSRHDELVSAKTENYLKFPNFEVNILENSGHYGYSEEDLAYLKQRISDLINNI